MASELVIDDNRLTSDDQPETAIRAQKTGALYLMLKPVTVEALEKIVKKTKLFP